MTEAQPNALSPAQIIYFFDQDLSNREKANFNCNFTKIYYQKMVFSFEIFFY